MAYFASDFGFHEHRPLEVHAGDTFRVRAALGLIEYRVLRPHRNSGYWEVVFDKWLTPVEPFRQGFVGSLDVFSGADIRRAMQAA